MKKHDFIFTALILLCTTLLIAAVPTEKEGAIYEDTVRLHILANSDEKADQRLKLEIRDLVLEKYGDILSMAKDKQDAVANLEELIPEIKADVDKWITMLGMNYSSSVELGVEWYDTREYEDFTLPKGYYTSLRIMLGKAEGKNWWCVMFPPLCLDIATEESPSDDALLGYTDEEAILISTGKYNLKFKLLELLSELTKNP